MEGSIRVNDTTIRERDALGIWATGEIAIHTNDTSHFLIIETPVNQK
jgi:redox-sensitive bicupin YhaK (pirin superfamily)